MNDSGDQEKAGQNQDDVDAKSGSSRITSPFSSSLTAKVPSGGTGEAVSDDEYNMTYPNRGYALLINNRTFQPHTRMGDRNGTDRDAANLHQLLTVLGFTVLRRDNQTVQQMIGLVRQFGGKDHSQNDCFVCAILSHGEEGVLYGTDSTVQIDDLTNPFKGSNCPSLVGKPKIFILQACRGTNLDHGADKADALMDVDPPQVERIPTEADFLMAYSVVPGYFSWRNSTRGSWFVQAICDVFDRYAEELDKYDVLKLLTRVSRKVAYDFESNAAQAYMNKKKQVPCITSMLTKDLYFRTKNN